MKRWTVLILALVLTGCTTIAGASGTTQSAVPEKVTVQVYVDNQLAGNTTAYQAEGRLYAPVDAIQNGRRVEVVGNEVRIFLHASESKDPRIDTLNPEYDAKIQKAVTLLHEKAPDHYRRLAQYSGVIIPAIRNANYPEMNVITIAKEDLDKGTITWIAGTLAHESEHLRIFHSDRALAANTKENERLAYQASLDALKLVGADQREIDWTLKALKDPPTWGDNAK